MRDSNKHFVSNKEIEAMSETERISMLNSRIIWDAKDLSESELEEIKAFAQDPLPTKTS